MNHYLITIDIKSNKMSDVEYVFTPEIEGYNPNEDYLDRVFGSWYAYVSASDFSTAKDRAYYLIDLKKDKLL